MSTAAVDTMMHLASTSSFYAHNPTPAYSMFGQDRVYNNAYTASASYSASITAAVAYGSATASVTASYQTQPSVTPSYQPQPLVTPSAYQSQSQPSSPEPRIPAAALSRSSTPPAAKSSNSKYAGPTFHNSPAPWTLPIPDFLDSSTPPPPTSIGRRHSSSVDSTQRNSSIQDSERSKNKNHKGTRKQRPHSYVFMSPPTSLSKQDDLEERSKSLLQYLKDAQSPPKPHPARSPPKRSNSQSHSKHKQNRSQPHHRASSTPTKTGIPQLDNVLQKAHAQATSPNFHILKRPSSIPTH